MTDALIPRIRDALDAAGVRDPGLDRAGVEELSRDRATTVRLHLPGGGAWVARVDPAPDPDAPGTAAMMRATVAAAGRGIAPPVIMADVAREVLITESVPGHPLSPAALTDPARVARVGARLAELHARCTFGTAVDPLHGLDAPPAPSEPPEVAAVRGRRHELRATLGRVDPVDVHGDLVPANLVEDGERIWIVDFEYAGVGDPRLDVVYLAVTARLDAAAGRRLVDAWGGALDGEAEGAARELIRAMLARWAALRG